MKIAIISLLGAFATMLGGIGYASSAVVVPEISGDYRMTVDEAAVDVYRVPMPEPSGGGIEDKSEWHPYSYAPFVATGAVEVCVKSGVFDLSKTRILPKSKGVAAITQSADTICFRMMPPMTLVLEPKGRHRALVVSANVPEEQVKKSGEGEECGKVRSFAPGFHRAGEIKLGDGDTLYLAPGAWVEGWIKAKGKNITVCGSGVLSGACWKWREGPTDKTGMNLSGHLALLSGENITVKDVTFFSSWGWTLVFNSVTNALVDNVKVIGGRVINDDGIDICRAKDVVIRNSFVRCQDDCITPKWWCENFVCTNMTLWTDAANVFRTGYECESGASGLVYRNHLIKDIDILHLALNRRPATNYWANNAICIQPSHGQKMSDLVYEDLRFHECGPKDIFLNVKTMPITQGLDFKEAGTLTNLVLRNIHLPDSQGGMSVYLSAHDDAHPIEGVRFVDVTGYGPVTVIGTIDTPNPLDLFAVEDLYFDNFRVTSGKGPSTSQGKPPPGLVPGYDVEPEKVQVRTSSDYVTPEHLRYPYLSTYYVRPTVVKGDRVKIGWYVTDWRHSLCRYGDASARFDVELRYSRDCREWKSLKRENVPSGDGEFDLGPLPLGEYTFGIKCIDRRSQLPSATIWHEFRVVGTTKIPADKVYRMTKADLAKYGLTPDPGYERRVNVELEVASDEEVRKRRLSPSEAIRQCHEGIKAYLAAHPHQPGEIPGYTVYVPTWKGVEPNRVFERLQVVYDPDYDTNAVEQAAMRNTEGIQRMLDEKASVGFREFVFLPGVYRMTAFKTLELPSNLRVNLNGATLKLNPFTGCRGTMICFPGAKDTQLVNGTIEGDYYAHDYAHSPNKTEWPIMVSFNGYCRNCSLEDVTLVDSAAYGAGNGLGVPGGPGKRVTFDAKGATPSFFYVNAQAGFEPGGLDWRTGALDANDSHRWTTKPYDIAGLKPFKYLQLSKYLGWQGMRTRNWNYTVCFFDANGKFVSGEVASQYRFVLIPPEAATARFSVEVRSKEEAEKSELALMRIKFPWNCTIRRCRFVHCRVVGYAASAMRNFLFEDNEFTRSGEAITLCAFDAEDGADLMQDAFFVRNRFHDNPNNELLTCAGLNFVLEANRGNLRLHPRTYSYCVRSNVCNSASFGCGTRNKTGYWRLEGNEVREALSIGTGSHALDNDWSILLEGRTFKGDAAQPLKVEGGASGVFRNCTFEGVQASPGTAVGCRLSNCKAIWSRHCSGRWENSTAEDCVFVRRDATNEYSNCTFRNCNFSCVQFGAQSFDGCTLENVRFPSFHRGGTAEFSGTVKANCTLLGTNSFAKEMTVEQR